MSVNIIFDIETNGLYKDVTEIHCIALKRIGIDKEPLLYTFFELDEAIAILSKADRLIGHNIIQYDLPVIKKLFPEFKCTDDIIDTMNLSYIKFSYYNEHSLEAWGDRLGFEKFNPVTGKEYTPEEWKIRKKTKDTIWSEYTSEMGAYCKQDVRVTELLLWKLDVDSIPRSVIDLSNKFSFIIADQVNNGCRIDKEGLLKLQAQIEIEEQQAAQELLKQLPTFINYDFKVYKRNNQNKNIKAGDIEVIKLEIPFNLNSTQHWMRYLKEKYNYNPPLVRRKDKKEPTPCLDDDVLATIEDKYPEIKDLLLYKTANKIRKMIYTGDKSVYNLLDENDIIHGRLKTEGTVSGRCTHSNPNLSTMPSVRSDENGPIKGIKGKYAYEVRNLFIARPGFKQVGFDAKALEVCMLAHYANNDEFTDQVKNGDIHTWTQHKAGLHTRKQAKTFMYAFLYGAGKQKLATALSEGSDVSYDVNSVTKVINNFNKALPGLKKLQDDLKAQYNETGCITGLDGRQLHPRSDYTLLNLLLQSSGAIVMKQCLVSLIDELNAVDMKLGTDYNILLNVHDEVQAEVRPDKVEIYKECAQRAAVKTNEILKLNCPLQIDIKVGKSWAECH